MNIKTSLEKYLRENRVRENVDLMPYLSMRTKTSAGYFFEARTREDLIAAKIASLNLRVPLIILGGGTNLVATKEKLEALVVKNSYIEKKTISQNEGELFLSLSSGYPVSRLAAETIKEGWSGFEYFFGLPGTVGGAIYMNAKWTKPMIFFGDRLDHAYLVDGNGDVKKVDRNYFLFNYDFSILHRTKEIILEAIFRLKKEDLKILEARANEVIKYRMQTQPTGVHSSGCFFKNISRSDMERLKLPTTSAGYLIDKAGIKNLKVGGFSVSGKHANFLINKGDGKSTDLIKLIELIKTRVKSKFGIELEEEVVIV